MRYVAILAPELPPRVLELLRDPLPDAVWARKVSLAARVDRHRCRVGFLPNEYGDLEIETDEAIA